MELFLVVTDAEIQTLIKEEDVARLSANALIVRSDLSIVELSNMFRFSEEKHGTVAKIEYLAGWAPDVVADKVNRWLAEGQEQSEG